MTLEQLLNKLIDKGWKPMWWDAQKYKISFSRRKITIQLYHETHPEQEWIERSLRELVSKESWLWQFVCENGMTEKKIEYWEKFTWTQMLRYTDDYVWSMYQYYLIESALCDEDKLEQFLLDNIKIDE